MTNLVDFDRSLGDFLADGPNTAPEAPVIAALAHARTTPRRPDPLARLRSDVMSPPRRQLLGLRPGLVLAAVGLIVVSVGVAVVGSQRADPSLVPGPSALPAPSGSASAIFSAQVPITVAAGNPFILTVVGTTGELIGATSGQPGDGSSVDFGSVRIVADPSDENGLVVTWIGGPCESRATMTVDEGKSTIAILRETCTGDAIAHERAVVLRFSRPVVAAQWIGTIGNEPEPSSTPGASAVTGGPFQPIGSPAVAPIRVVLGGEVGNETSVDVVDESGLLVSAVAGPNTAGQEFQTFDASNDAPNVIRLTWPGAPCDTVHRLTIDATMTTLTLDLPKCSGDSLGVDRSLIVTFQDPVDAASLTTTRYAGRGGVDMPTWTVTAPDSGSGGFDLVLVDPGYFVEAIEGFFDPEVGAAGAGPTGLRLDQVDPTTVRLVWSGPACATTPVLAIDPSGETWRLLDAPCDGAAASVLRMIQVTLRAPRTVDTITVEAVVEAS